MKDASPTKELFLTSPKKSPEKSPEKDILSDLPRLPMSRPQSQLSNYSERYRPVQPPRTPSSSRRLTFGRPISRQSEEIDDEGDITITIENSVNVTPRRPRHKQTASSTSRPDSRLSTRSVSQEDQHPADSVFKRPESAAGRRQSGIPAPSDRRQSGILPPRRQSGIPAPARPASPVRSTSSSSFHSDTQQSVISHTTSAGSMGAPSMIPMTRRQSGAQSSLPMPKTGIPIPGRKSMGSGIPVPR